MPSGPLYTGNAVTFNVSGTGGGGPLSYTIDFGDGSNASGSLPVGGTTVNHTYTTAGSYPVVLSVSDGIASPAPYTSATVQVAQAVDPTAVVGDPITATVGQSVQFNGSNSTPAGGITGYAWNFGDGGTSTAANPTHTYTRPGTTRPPSP